MVKMASGPFVLSSSFSSDSEVHPPEDRLTPREGGEASRARPVEPHGSTGFFFCRSFRGNRPWVDVFRDHEDEISFR